MKSQFLAEYWDADSKDLTKFVDLYYIDVMLARYFADLGHYLKSGKVLILYGPRRVGKTTLLESFLHQSGFRYRLDTGDNIRIQKLLSSGDLSQILEYTEKYELIAIDEAQMIPHIGQALKMIVDQRPNLFVIVTGSS